MATKKEIEEHLKIALGEIGEIKPWFDKEVDAWVFSHPDYPVEYDGESEKEVIKNYPKYLKEFIKHRLDNKLSPIVMKKTKGRGGNRPGAGRPKGTIKEPKQRMYVPKDIASWLKDPEHVGMIRLLMFDRDCQRKLIRKPR